MRAFRLVGHRATPLMAACPTDSQNCSLCCDPIVFAFRNSRGIQLLSRMANSEFEVEVEIEQYDTIQSKYHEYFTNIRKTKMKAQTILILSHSLY